MEIITEYGKGIKIKKDEMLIMPDDENDMPNIDKDDITYLSGHKKSEQKPNIDQSDITYFPNQNKSREKLHMEEESSHGVIPNINPGDIAKFPPSNPSNSVPNIDPNRTIYFLGNSRYQKVKFPPKFNSSPSTDNLKQQVVEESYLSDEKRKELYKEILIYLIELRNEEIDLKNFLKSIRKEVDIRGSAVSELLWRIDVEGNQCYNLQLKVILYTFIHATLYIPNFDNLKVILATRSNKQYLTISKMVEETIDGFKDIAGIDLYDFSLEDLRNLEKSDIIDNTEIKDVFFNEKVELSDEEIEELFNEDDNIIPDEIQTFVKNEMKTLNINIPNFRESVKEYIEKFLKSIDCTKTQAEIIKSKSLEILDDHIERANNKQTIIPSDANLKIITGAIIYALIQSEKDIPKVVTGKEIMEMLEIGQGSIYDYYHKHFKELYPKVKKQAKIDKEKQRLENRKYTKHHFTAIKGLLRIRNIISLYFFKYLKDKDIDTKRFIVEFKSEISENKNLPEQITQDDLNTLRELSEHPDFDKYFLDLTLIIKYIINSSILHKKIGANPTISYISDALKGKNITLFQSSNVFPMTIADIYDLLRIHFPIIIPERSHTDAFQNLTDEERNLHGAIIGSKIKLYVIKNIYNGIYFQDGLIQCPECKNDGIGNLHTYNLSSLQFDHLKNNKVYSYTSKTFYDLFRHSRGDPRFLEMLIVQMEQESVVLTCTNHHNLKDIAIYSKIFSHLINWDKLFSLQPILIHLIVRISVNSFYNSEDISTEFRRRVRKSILIDLKRKYIIDIVYNGICPCCGEFNTRNHISAFHGSHFDKSQKTVEPSSLFRTGMSCCEIVQSLGNETVGFVCGNCHSILDNIKDRDTLDKIYGDPIIVNDILRSQNRILSDFEPLTNKEFLIGEPFKKNIKLDNSHIEYLLAINDIISFYQEATNELIADKLSVTRDSVRATMRNPFFTPFINVYQSYERAEKRYNLTDFGKEAVSMLLYFRDYYSKDVAF